MARIAFWIMFSINIAVSIFVSGRVLWLFFFGDAYSGFGVTGSVFYNLILFLGSISIFLGFIFSINFVHILHRFMVSVPYMGLIVAAGIEVFLEYLFLVEIRGDFVEYYFEMSDYIFEITAIVWSLVNIVYIHGLDRWAFLTRPKSN